MQPLDRFNLMDPDTQQCPYEFYKQTREQAPVSGIEPD
jgi:hypothetical protein